MCKGETYESDLILDIASEVYSLKEGDKFTMSLARTLRLDGKPDDDSYNQDGKVSIQCRDEEKNGYETNDSVVYGSYFG